MNLGSPKILSGLAWGLFLSGTQLLPHLCPCLERMYERILRLAGQGTAQRREKGSALWSTLFLRKLRGQAWRLTAGCRHIQLLLLSLTTGTAPVLLLSSRFLAKWGKESFLAACHAGTPTPDLLSPKPAADVGWAGALLPIRESHAEITAPCAWHSERNRAEGSGAAQ